jgi:chitosanase
MPKCIQCQADAPENQRYCGNCGSELGQAPLTNEAIKALVAAELQALTKDGKILEYETSVAIVERVSGWAKLFAAFVGVPVALGLGLLAILGVNSYESFVAKITAAQTTFKNSLDATANESSNKLKAEARAQLDALSRLGSETATLKAKLLEQQKIVADIQRLNDALNRIEQLLTSDQLEHIRQLENLFEFGSTTPNYSLVSVFPGAGVTFGYINATRRGQLGDLLVQYMGRPGAKYAKEFEKYRTLLQARDPSLDKDEQFFDLLRKAGADPVMRSLQDDVFAKLYFKPAFEEAKRLGIRSALGIAVIVDSLVHGSWQPLRESTSRALGGTPSSGIDEKLWVREYLNRRRAFLKDSPRPDLRATAVRVETLINLAESGNWQLAPPIIVNGKKLER